MAPPTRPWSRLLDPFKGLIGQRAARPTGQEMLSAVTSSVPTGLIARTRLRPYDPKILDLFMPDSLARQKGWAIYEEMMDDAQVRSVSMIKRYAPTSNGWTLTPADESTQAGEINDFCRVNLENMEKGLEETIGQVLESTFTGLSISESLYRIETYGQYKGKIMLSDVQTRPPSMVDVNFDASGTITGVTTADMYGGWGEDAPLHPFKFVVHTWQGRYGSPYGRGDGRAVYRHWWAKDFLMRAWAVYMDKFGAPAIYGKQPTSMSQEEAGDFLGLLESLQHEGVAVLPDGWDFQWVFPPGGSANAQGFLTAIEWHDSMIAKAVLGSSLSTDQNRGTGTFAQAKVHEDTRDLLLRKVKLDAENIIVRRQMLRRLVRLNYGREAAMLYTPRFVFSPPNLEEMGDLADIIGKLVTAQVIDPKEAWIRERLHLPTQDDVKDDVRTQQLEDQEHANAVALKAGEGQLAVQDAQHQQALVHQADRNDLQLQQAQAQADQGFKNSVRDQQQGLRAKRADAALNAKAPISSDTRAAQQHQIALAQMNAAAKGGPGSTPSTKAAPPTPPTSASPGQPAPDGTLDEDEPKS